MEIPEKKLDVRAWFDDLPCTTQHDYGIEEFVEEYERMEKLILKGGQAI